MAAPSFKLVVTDLFYNQIGELTDYFDFSINRRVNGIDTGSLRVRSDNPMFYTLASMKCMIKLYVNGVLQAWMYVWTAETVGEGDKISLSVTLAAPAVRMDTLTLPLSTVYGKFIMSASTDRYRMFYHLFAANMMAQGIKLPSAYDPTYPLPADLKSTDYSSWATLLAFGGQRPGLGLAVEYGDLGSTMLYDASEDNAAGMTFADRLAKLASGSAGFDWYWQPSEPRWWGTTQTLINANDYTAAVTAAVSSNIWTEYSTWEDIPAVGSDTFASYWSRSIATLRVANKIGTDRTGTAFFEYGVGRSNLSGFRLSGTRQYQASNLSQRLANQASGNVYTSTWTQGSLDSVADWGRMSSLGQFDVDDPTYLQQLLDEAVTLRQFPLRRLEITPVASYGEPFDPPLFGTDYDLGDTVTVRIMDPASGAFVVNGIVRVQGVTYSLRDSGVPTISVTISPEAA